MRKIVIDPITRLEGHGRIDIFLDKAGEVKKCLLVVPELRGFEKFMEGRALEELPRITSRICGVCPEAHHAASVKAAEAAYKARIPVAALLIRRLQYNAFVARDHATHFYALGGPDFIVGTDADKCERNLVGVMAKVGREAALKLVQMRKAGNEVATMLGGRPIHPVGMVVGGQSKRCTNEMQARLVEIGRLMVEFSLFTQKVFEDLVLSDEKHLDLIRSQTFRHATYYMGLVDEKGKVEHYDGHVRVVDPDGKEHLRFESERYLDHISEHVETWTYLKFPFLKSLGWHGFMDGARSGVYRVGPLAMLNAAEGMQTPLAQAEYEKMFSTLGKPSHATLAYHWARIIEMLQCSELVLKLAEDERLTDPDVRTLPTETPLEGVGIVEAPRGLLVHHYVSDTNGLLIRANLVVGTTHNHAPIQLSVEKAASTLIRQSGVCDERLLNMVEMAFRAYDPCLGCATHGVQGRIPLNVGIYDDKGSLVRSLGASSGKND